MEIPPPENNKEGERGEITPTLRTLKTDAEESIKSGKTTVVSVAAEAERLRTGVPDLSTPTNGEGGRRIAMISGIVLLLAVSISAAVYFFVVSPGKTTPPKVAQTATSFFVAERERRIDTGSRTGRNIIDAVNHERAAVNMTVGGIENIIFTKTAGTETQSLSAEGLFKALSINAPSALVRNLNPEFMFGFYAGSSVEPFLILKIPSYEQAYASMLYWEKTMAADLKFLAPTRPPVDEEGAVFGRNFSDEILKNKDIRVLKDAAGQSILLYSFTDEKTLIITSTEETFAEILRRLGTPRIVR